MARTLSKTDASTAKSTPPKTGKDAVIQRMNNTIKDLAKFMDKQGIRSIVNQGLRMSDKDVEMVKKNLKKDPPNYKGKAYGGQTKKMATGGKTTKGRSKMMMGGKPMAKDPKTGKMMYGGKARKK